MNFLGRFSENTQIENFVNTRPVQAELFHAGGRTDRQTDTTKPIVAIRNFENALNLSETCQNSQFSVPVLIREPPKYKFILVHLKQHA